MPKRRSKNPEEYYRGLVRELEKENRSLKQKLRQHEKYSQEIEIAQDNEDTIPVIKPAISYCTKCGDGELRSFELIGRVFVECNSCDFRKRIK